MRDLLTWMVEERKVTETMASGLYKMLDSNDPGVPLIYGGTRLDWYSLNGGCCPRDHFGSEAPDYPALDLPLSALADTLLLPITLLTELGVRVGVRGGS